MTDTLFERELREQPEVITRLLARGEARARELADEIRRLAPRYALIAARGSSDNAARYAKYLLGEANRLVVALAAPSLFTRYHAPPVLEGALVIGVSQSGRSPDVVEVLAEAARQGALTVAITNEPGSPLAGAARHVLPLEAGEERAVAASKTYTAQLVTLAMLSAALEGSAARWEALALVPGAVERALGCLPAARAHARRFAGAGHAAVLGRGFNHATACEIALKLKETSYLVAEPYSWADFLHGPVAMVEPGFPVVLVAPSGAVADDAPGVLDLALARGAAVVVLSDRPDLLARAAAPLALPAVPEWLSPIPAAVAGQIWALALAESRGLDPDRPRGLQKITETR